MSQQEAFAKLIDVISSLGGGTQYNEDVAHNTGDLGTVALVVRSDAGGALADTTGDYSPLQVDASGNLRVNIAAGSSAGTEYTEDAAAAANPAGGAVIVVRDDARGGSLTTTDGDNVALRGTNAGELYVKHVDALTVSSHAVTNAGTFAVQDAAAEASLSVLDDWDETNRCAVNPISGQVGVQGASGIATALTQRVVLATDVALPAGTNAIGKLAANSGVDIGDVDVTSLTHGKTILAVGGSAALSGNNTLVAADASNRIKVKAFSLTTTSTTAVTCIFQDGASGTELWRVVLQAATSTSTGANLAVPAPDWLFATTANTLLNLNLSGAITVHWALSYFKEAA